MGQESRVADSQESIIKVLIRVGAHLKNQLRKDLRQIQLHGCWLYLIPCGLLIWGPQFLVASWSEVTLSSFHMGLFNKADDFFEFSLFLPCKMGIAIAILELWDSLR